ncbi:hypothetical protein HPB50_014056 [Hyalomma asiaticum]|uniref:Uncharacterized protein n=1 Tax=Hyalomma asiaticum TaxID=266040 RepID=A0ACB7TIE9_HYAAI|nr:hypothetical protein HPB50_014056 [Hyalomma asiaticum]
MRKKRRPCSILASNEDSGVAPCLPDVSMYSSVVPMVSTPQRLTVVKPIHQDESLVELFALIESNPCLWKNDSRNFKNLRLKRRLWDRFAVHLQKRFPMLGPFTADNLRYVYSIKRRQYYDELKDKTVRTESGELEYSGRWKFFDCLSFLRVHSEPFRTAVTNPMFHFETDQLLELEDESDDVLLDDGETSAVEPDELCILPDSILGPSEVHVNDKPAVSVSVAYASDRRSPSSPPPTKKARLLSSILSVQPEATCKDVPRVESVHSLSPAVGGLYDECDQFGNIIANYMRRLSDKDRLEFHCHIMSCTKDFFKCFMRFNNPQSERRK